jgi:hypothetical protein
MARTWDVSHQVKPAAPAGARLADADLEKLWADLGSSDAVKAFAALAKLGSYPDQMLALARAHIKPAPAPDAGRVRQLMDDLQSPQFSVRQKASAELEKLGEAIVPEINRALAGDLALEARQRLEAARKRLTRSTASDTLLRELRMLELLELQRGDAYRSFIESLAAGAPGARLTVETQAMLRRLR